MKRKNLITIICMFFLFSFIAFLPSKINASAITLSSRIAGINRYETSANISKSYCKNTSEYAVIASGEDFPDALCATPLAKKYNAPILLSNSNELNIYTKTELLRLKVKNVIVIGGTGAISQNTENEISSLGINTTRISGINRYETSKNIAEQLSLVSKAILATGDNFPDALSISSIAAMQNMPILLTQKDKIPDSIQAYLNNNEDNITDTYVVGGTGVISASVLNSLKNPQRLCGSNRYSTNTAILNKFITNLDLSNVYTATGKNFPDALSCSVLSTNSKSPILLAEENTDASTVKFINDNYSSVKNVTAVGGTGVISDYLLHCIIKNFPPDPPDIKLINRLNLNTSSQAILIEVQNNTDVHGVCSTFSKENGIWSKINSYPCVVGMRGVSADRHEGDYTTPEGIFGFLFEFGSAQNPGTKMEYRKTQPGDYWSSVRTGAEYNTWVHYDGDPVRRFGSTKYYEDLYNEPLYKYAAALDFNYYQPKVIGKGSAIFFHIAPSSGGGTAGCIAISKENLVTVLKWMDPSQNPKICIGTPDYLNSLIH